MEKSRTEYSTMNTVVAMISRIAAILMGFVTRVVFTHTLSESYVGINGLFTDILNVLSLTELGVETAISYALYRPIAQGDIRKQQILMRMFRTFYRITAGCVVVLGLSIIPFFDVLMKNRPDVDHLMLIYFLYLANSVVSYLLVYKRTLIEVHQLNYIVLLYQTAFLILQDICQIVILFTTHNFIFFLSIYIVCTLLSNICISRKADRMYPYLKEKTKEQLPEDERKDIFRNIKAMLMHKLGNVVVNNTDNLLISSFVGVISVGIYSNYFLLIGSVRQVLDQIFQGITASVGNLGATEDEGRVKSIFETAFFIGNWLYGAAAICLYELLNPFVELAFGKQYLFDMPVVLILCINFYINGTRKAVLTFRDSLGLFWFDRYKALVEAVKPCYFTDSGMEIWNIRSVCRNISLYHAHLCMGGTICAVQTQTACEGGSVFCPLCDLYSGNRCDLVWNRPALLICGWWKGDRIFKEIFHMCCGAEPCDASLLLPHKRIWNCKEKSTCYMEKEVDRWKKKIKRKNLYCAVFWMQHCM